MSTSTVGLFLRHLALSAEVGRLGTASDHDLLAAYEAERGQAAFTELMRRHGPMVLRTCRRLLGRGPDAEDAFQATFILLARQAGQLGREAAGQRSLGGWLHRVAYRTAANVLRTATRRRVHERQASVKTHPDSDPVAEATWNEVRPILDAELDALPDEARRLLIAYYLQEKTYTEVSAELGLPRSSVARHLERARGLLAARLARRGITVSVPLLAVLLGEAAKGAGVPAVLLVHTVEAARRFIEQVAGALSDNVARLVKGGLAQMTKSSTHFSIWLAGWVGLLGAGLIACQTLKAWPDRPPESEPPATPAAERRAQEGNKQAHTDLYGDPLPPGALARLGTMRLRHNGNVQSLVFTPDGKNLVTAGGDNLPRLWDAATGKLMREFNNIPKPQLIGGSYYAVSGAALSPDGRILAVRSGRMGNLYLLETATGKRLHEFKMSHLGSRFSSNFAFSPNGQAIAAQLYSLDLDGKTIVGRLELRDVATGRPLWQKNEKVFGVAFSPDGKTLASAGSRGDVRLWDARTGESLRALSHKGEIKRIVFSPDGRILAVGYGPSKDQSYYSVHLWDAATGKEVRQLGEPGKSSIHSLVFSPDGKIIAGFDKGQMCLWETATGKEMRRCQNANTRWDWSPVAFSPGGKVLAAMDDNRPLVRFWDVASGKALPSRLPTGHEGGINSVVFTPNGQTLISAGRDHTIRLWNTRTSQERLSLPCTFWFYGFSKAVLSPDGTMLAATCLDAPDRAGIRLWDAATGKELRRLDSGNGRATQLVFSPDGKMLAEGFWPTDSRGSAVVHLWDVASGKRCERELAGAYPVFSPDGSILATAETTKVKDRGMIRFWEVATGKEVHSVRTNENIYCLALSPDGKALATGNDTITLYPLSWDEPSGVQVGAPRLVAHTPHESVTTLAFSPDGRMLASSGRSDHTVHLWETASGKERARFQDFAAAAMSPDVWSLSFSADGRRLASGNADSTILIWDVTGRLRGGEGRAAKLSDKELEGLWTDLASSDAARAGRAVWTLVAAGPRTVSFLRERLRPMAARVTPEAMARLLADLDADDFRLREKARGKLEQLGESCEPALRQTLAKRPSVEMRRSLQRLLSRLEEERKGPSGEVLRGVRAVEVLEQIGTPEAQRLVDALTRGMSGFRLTEEAHAALRRLDQRREQ